MMFGNYIRIAFRSELQRTSFIVAHNASFSVTLSHSFSLCLLFIHPQVLPNL